MGLSSDELVNCKLYPDSIFELEKSPFLAHSEYRWLAMMTGRFTKEPSMESALFLCQEMTEKIPSPISEMSL